MVAISANLGFLFAERPLVQRVAAARAAGFDAIEMHWPYEVPVAEMKAALAEAGLPLLGINTIRGDAAKGDFGLSALPGREAEARTEIDRAIDYAAAVGCAQVHVMAGKAEGDAAFACFTENLRYAAARGARAGVGILIEPLNHYDAPGYFLRTLDTAVRVQDAVGADNVRIMFDCYHLQIEGGDLSRRFRAHLPRIGHVQFAAVPDRGEPGQGELDFGWLLPDLAAAGWSSPMGAEYKPRGKTEDGLGWLGPIQAA